jgi:hypothetical protein
MEWLYFVHKDTGGTTEVPDEPGVKEWHEARGWKLTEKPDEVPFIPTPGTDGPKRDTEWVTLFHPIVNASHEFPNNREAIAGALEAGWQYPESPEAIASSEGSPAGEIPANEAPEPDPAPKTRKSRTASATADEEKE